MINFFKTLFLGESEETEEEKVKRNFDVLKYDGIKALKMRKPTYAIRCFNEALKLEEDIEVLELLSNAYAQEEQMDEAINTVSRIVEIEPENIVGILMRANLNLLAGRDEDVIIDCDRILVLDSSNLTVYFLKGRAEKSVNDYLGAINSFSQAIKLKDNFVEARLLRAELLLDTADYQSASEDIEKVIELSPEEENAYLIRGRLQEIREDREKAEESFRYVLELNPFNEQAYLKLGGIFMARNQTDKAIALFDEAIELRSDFSLAYRERSRARTLKGDQEGASEDLEKAEKLDVDAVAEKDATYSDFGDMYKNRPL